MVKKVLGVLFFVAAVLVLIGMIGNMMSGDDHGSVVAAWGSVFGSLIAAIVYLLSGIFMLGFDGVCKKKLMSGFRAREKQCAKVILFIVVYFVFILGAMYTVVMSGAGNYTAALLKAELPYFIPFAIFVGMMCAYVIPYKRCKKQFGLNDAVLRQYLSCGQLRSYSQDHFVVANDAVLFFPKLFCLIPFAQIASVKFTNLGIEQDIVFTLTNGKKVELVGGKQKYNSVMTALNVHR